MKKKLFSKLLMGAILLASMSSFVSCKDYDDDIQNLQTQIDNAALKSEMNALQTRLDELKAASEKAQATAESALTKANAAATQDALNEVRALATQNGLDVAEAIKKANEAAAAAAAAQATGDKALADAAAAQATGDKAAADASAAKTAAEAAQKTAEAAAAAAAAAQAKAEKAIEDAAAAAAAAGANANEIANLKQQLTTFSNSLQNYVTQSQLSEEVTKLTNMINNMSVDGSGDWVLSDEEYEFLFGDASAKARTAVQSKVTIGEVISAIIKSTSAATDKLWSIITSVNLFANAHEDWSPTNRFDHTLLFLYAIEKGDATFPLVEDIADITYTFKKDNRPTFTDSVMVRISPAYATFNAEDVVLINSKGENIIVRDEQGNIDKENSLIDSVSVEKYNRLFTLTRAEAQETGLYVIKFKVKDNFNKDEQSEKEFREASIVRQNGQDRYIAYAIGIRSAQNDKEINGVTVKDNTRYVISEFDLNIRSLEAEHAWNFKVNGKDVDQIHNRFAMCEDGMTSTSKVTELNWLDEPSFEVITSGSEKNAEDRCYNPYLGYNDNRQGRKLLSVEKGEPINISFDVDNQPNVKIKGFYVTLDMDFALESQPSEVNAWTSYSYTGGVGYTTQSNKTAPVVIKKATMHEGNNGQISIDDMNNVAGDVIGFRVYAVNLDGTLVDPDGRAFYVKVGETVDDSQTIKGDNTDETVNVITTKKNGSESEKIKLDDIDFDKNVTEWQLIWGESNPDVYSTDVMYTALSWHSPIAKTDSAFNARYNNTRVLYGPTNFFTLTFTNKDGDEISLAQLAQYTKKDENLLSTVKVAINDAEQLLDNKTYKLYLKGVKKSAIVEEDIQLIALNVKKSIPTELPDVRVKAGQNGKLTYIMKPYLHTLSGVWTWGNAYYTNAEGNTETLDAGTPLHAWDVRFAAVARYYLPYETYNFADVYSLLNPETGANVLDQNYYFEFEDAGLEKHELDNAVPAIIRYNENGVYNVANFTDNTYAAGRGNNAISYTLPAIQKGIVSVAGVTKNVQVGYTYKNVSLKKNENNVAIFNDVKAPAKNKFEYTYKSAFDLKKVSSSATGELTYATPATLVSDNPSGLPNVGIYYTTATPVPNAWLELPGTTAGEKTYLPTLIAKYYVKIVPGSAELTGDIKDYFVLSNFNYSNGYASFAPIMDTKDHNITSDVEGAYKFVIEDVMGNRQTVTVKLKMKKP